MSAGPAPDGAVLLRPLRADEAAAAHECAYATFADLDRRGGQEPREHTEELRQRGTARVAHLQRTDPDGAWAAERDGRLVGVALALRREVLWFLALLVVEPAGQGAGTGRRLLEAALRTSTGARAGWLLSSPDPRALRRYSLAGFALEPCYSARGPVDRDLLPATPQVRDGSCEDDRDLVDDVVRAQRGAPYGPDVDALCDRGRLLVVDGALGRGFAVVRPGAVQPLAATSVAAARSLLWAALAETGPAVEVDFLTAEQQWAVEIAVAAGLSLRPAGSSCWRRRLGPVSPYLPSGAYG